MEYCLSVYRATVVLLALNTGITYSQDNIHHQCYHEGGSCTIRRLSCDGGATIQVLWSRIGYSDYWPSDGTRRNCSISRDDCYRNTTMPYTLCTGQIICDINSCHVDLFKVAHICGAVSSNYLRIHYTCVTHTETSTSSTETLAQSPGHTHKSTAPDILLTTTSITSGSTSDESITPQPEADNQGDTSKESQVWLIPVIAAVCGLVVVAIIVTVVVIVILKRRKKRADPESHDDERILHTENNNDKMGSATTIVDNPDYVTSDNSKPGHGRIVMKSPEYVTGDSIISGTQTAESSASSGAKQPATSAPSGAKQPVTSAPRGAKPPTSTPSGAEQPATSAPSGAKQPVTSAPREAKPPTSAPGGSGMIDVCGKISYTKKAAANKMQNGGKKVYRPDTRYPTDDLTDDTELVDNAEYVGVSATSPSTQPAVINNISPPNLTQNNHATNSGAGNGDSKSEDYAEIGADMQDPDYANVGGDVMASADPGYTDAGGDVMASTDPDYELAGDCGVGERTHQSGTNHAMTHKAGPLGDDYAMVVKDTE